jgi:hypothetical protein
VRRPSGQEDDLVAPATQQFQVAAGRRAGRLYRLLAAAAAGDYAGAARAGPVAAAGRTV